MFSTGNLIILNNYTRILYYLCLSNGNIEKLYYTKKGGRVVKTRARSSVQLPVSK